ncbi:hypothetical protein O181_004930 [Austropuccinia psidii MF-1]|uniref:Uncharacterized protein n=1 Tax=Austropuccinia psidii MF-1 TaxID=1389203 RepID=A0A9Q3BHE7_9BASI|nr:hypothetical protein [Austropuccinia psidii MF-1]
MRSHLDRGPNIGEAPSRKEERVPRRSSSFSRVVGAFPGIPRITFKGPGEDGEDEEEILVQEKSLMVLKLLLLLWGHLKVLEGQLYPSIVSLSLINMNHIYWKLCIRRLRLWQIFKMLHLPKFKDHQHSRIHLLRHQISLIGLNPSRSEVLFSPSSLFLIMKNEMRKADTELDGLRIKEGGHVFLYIAYFISLASRIGYWGERALIHHFRKVLDSHPSRICSLQDLMDVTLELDTRYHERQKEKNNHQEKKTEASNSSSSHHQNSSIASHKKKNFRVQKRGKSHSSLLNRDHRLMVSEKERRIKEALLTYFFGNHILEACFKRPQNQPTQPSGRFPSQGKA